MSEENQVVENIEAAPVQEAPSEVSFVETLDESLRDSGNLKDFSSANDLAKSYVELQRMVGNSVRVPSSDASAEAKQDFFEKIKDVDGVLFKDDPNLKHKLGAPESADAYKFEEKIDSSIYDYISPQVDVYKQKALELGLTEHQASELLSMQQGFMQQELQQLGAQREAAAAHLKEKWGSDFDSRMDAAKRAANIYADKYGDDVRALLDGPAGNNPAFITMLADMAEGFKEKGHEGMGGVQFGMTPEGAQAKIAEKRSDRGFMRAYQDSMDPGHSRAVAEMQKLYDIAFNS